MMGLPNGCCPDDRQDAEGGSRGCGPGGSAVTDHKRRAAEIVKGALVTLALLGVLGVAALFMGSRGAGVARVENRHVQRATELYVDARSQLHAVVQEAEDNGEFVPFLDLTEIRLGRDPMVVCDSIESALAESLVQVRLAFQKEEPREEAPRLVVVKPAADAGLTEAQLGTVQSMLAKRGLTFELVLDDDDARLPDTYYQMDLEWEGTAEQGVLTGSCRGYSPNDEVWTFGFGDIPYGLPPQVTTSDTWQTIFGQVAGAGVLGALILLAYLFVDAGAHGRYTWPLRIGTAAAFVAVCILLWQIGLSG